VQVKAKAQVTTLPEYDEAIMKELRQHRQRPTRLKRRTQYRSMMVPRRRRQFARLGQQRGAVDVPARFCSAVKSTADNTSEKHIFLTRIAAQSKLSQHSAEPASANGPNA
jgi:hypothetical protein